MSTLKEALKGFAVIDLTPPTPGGRDVTESLRRQAVAELNAQPATREELERGHGQVWNTDELRKEFEVTGFMAPYVVVRRLSDDKRGSLTFTHDPRWYFDWKED